MSSQESVFICCVLFFVAICVVTADEDVDGEAGKVIVKALGKSGKIMIRLKEKKESDAVVVQMEKIEEYDSDGNTVGATGRRKHTFNSFANQNFSLSNVVNTAYKNLDCKSFDITGFLRGPNATLKVTIYIFKASGEIDIGENETDVIEIGTVKWSIEIQNWEFCGSPGSNCKKGGKDETGHHLDFTISVKSKVKPMKRKRESGGAGKRRKLRSYDLGDNVNMGLSEEVKVDGAWNHMEDGYPTFEQKGLGLKNIFTFRFPKFNSTILYDPTVDATAPTSGSTATSPFSAFLVALSFSLAAFFHVFN